MKTLVDVLVAVKAKLSAIPLATYDRDPDPSPTGNRWVILSIDGGNLYSTGLDDRHDQVQMFLRPMAVGTSQAAALDAFQQIRTALEGWDIFPDERSASVVREEETTPPLLPSTGVAGAFRYTMTPTYKICFDR